MFLCVCVCAFVCSTMRYHWVKATMSHNIQMYSAPLQGIPYVTKSSRLNNFANRYQKGGAEIFATKIFMKAALVHCITL